jgi:uridine kinase
MSRESITRPSITRPILTIDGIDGSGKSTFARRLLAALAGEGVPGALVSIDDFRRPLDWAAVDSEADAYYDRYFDLALCERCLAAFAAGAPGVTIPQFDPVAERSARARDLVFEGAAAAIVEGVFPLRVPSAAAGLVIYLDTSPGEARRRILERDLAKGRSREDILRRIDRRYAPGQARYHAAFDPRGRAGVVIDNEQPAAPRALRRDLGGVDAPLRAALDRVLPR